MTACKTKQILLLTVLGLLMFGLTGCEQPRYLVVVKNDTTETINNIRFSFSGQTFPVKTLEAGNQDTAIFEQPPLGEQLSIQWQTTDGDQQQSFNTFTHIPRNHHRGKVVIHLLPGSQAELTYQPPK